jgi:hypothetical protein
MPRVPSPITSPPAQSFQPYDATAPGTDDTAPGSERTYDANGRDWAKVREGGKASMTDGSVVGGWEPDGGSNNGSAWKQT